VIIDDNVKPSYPAGYIHCNTLKDVVVYRHRASFNCVELRNHYHSQQ